MVRRRYERARQLARQVLRECGVDEPSKINPFAIVGRRKVRVRYGKLEGATARIFHLNEHAIIRISDAIIQEGRLRFSVAHEMGHFLLGHKLPTEAQLDDATAFYSPQQEREADAFAAEHNTPELWVRPYCEREPVSLDVVRAIAKAFRSSIVASAVRYVEFSSRPCAVAYSEHGRVTWAICSRSFPSRIPAQLRIGAGSIAFDYHETAQLQWGPRLVPPNAWLGRMSGAAEHGTLFEHAERVPEPDWGGVLSLLWFSTTPNVVAPHARGSHSANGDPRHAASDRTQH